MIKRVRIRLFVAASALLVLIAIVAAVGLPFSTLERVTIAILLAIGGAAGLSWVVGQMLQRDLRELVTKARATPGVGVDASDEEDINDWVHSMAADAERNHRALTRERALLAAVLESMSDGVIALDDTNRIVVMNHAARGLLGLASTPIGEVLIDVIRAPSLIELVRNPRVGTTELELRPGVRATARVTELRDARARILVLEDVTTMRRLETIRRDFVANVSHELRTPVSIIRVNAETLIGGASADATIAPKLLDGIHRNAERLGRMIADLLDLARLDAGQFRFERTRVNVLAASEAAKAAVEPAAAEREVAVHVEVDQALVACADSRALDHVLVNLVENAVKYGVRGGNVWIRAAGESARIRIDVSDDGPGIAPKHRERVFERFYRVDSGRARDAGGTGLGLAIVKHLVESMGGSVGVEGNTPQGTRFWLELPEVASSAAA